MSTSTSSSSTILKPEECLPDFFPRTVKPCIKASEAFFTCFFEKSKKRTDNDVESGILGIKECLSQKKAYEQCMQRYDTRIKDPKRHRVCYIENIHLYCIRFICHSFSDFLYGWCTFPYQGSRRISWQRSGMN